MCSFDCTLVPNPRVAPSPDGALFWPPSRSRLVLLFETQADTIIVRGIDPDLPDPSVFRFRADLLPDQKDRFIQAVRDGREPTLITTPPASNENRNAGASVSTPPGAGKSAAAKPLAGGTGADAIVITDTTGDGHGPNDTGGGSLPDLYRLVLPTSSSAARATGTQG